MAAKAEASGEFAQRSQKLHKPRGGRQPEAVNGPKACLRLSISAGLLITACREPTSVADLGGTIVGTEPSSPPEPVSTVHPSQPVPLAVPLTNEPAAAGDCTALRPDSALGMMVVPSQPRVGDVVRVVAASLRDEEPLSIRVDQGGTASDFVAQVLPGTPTTVTATWSATALGKVAIVVGKNGQAMACAKVSVRPAHHKALPVPAPRADGRPWLPIAAWDDGQEALFSAWVALLFTGDLERDLAFSNLEEVVRQPARNWLHNALGWQEDGERALRLRPDCADTPYFLRAYFAWKQGLPFGFYSCSRGSAKSAPRCHELRTAHDPASDRPSASSQLDLVQHFFRKTLAWGVHTGNGRVAHGDPVSELYPLALSRRAIRPGTIYADPYGHILVVTQWVAAHADRPGLLLAIDGQPDDSITRKRFWEGNFLYSPDPKLGGTGFKGFRPPRWQSPQADDAGDAQARLVFADDASLRKREMLGGVLPPGPMIDAVAFYDRMDTLMTPQGREPLRAMTQAVQALAEQARVRVTSVENGRKWQLAQPQAVAVMPDGFAIFETTGTWEDYSTPARDLRLLVAMDVVMGFESKIRRNPAAFGLAEPAAVERAVQAVAALRSKLLEDPTYAITYTRSDGSPWSLTLAQLIARQAAFEMAYNPNACVEARWGAANESDERRPCNRTIPSDQMAKMQSYRQWFHTRTRPARGQMRPE